MAEWLGFRGFRRVGGLVGGLEGLGLGERDCGAGYRCLGLVGGVGGWGLRFGKVVCCLLGGRYSVV